MPTLEMNLRAHNAEMRELLEEMIPCLEHGANEEAMFNRAMKMSGTVERDALTRVRAVLAKDPL